MSGKEFTWGEVQKHNTPDNCWIVIHGEAYDVTSWKKKHPGGEEILEGFAGEDATDQFEAFHRPHVSKYLNAYRKGRVVGDRPTLKEVVLNADYKESVPKVTGVDVGGADYRALRKQFWAEGWFEASTGYYVIKHLVMLAFAIPGIYLALYGSNFWLQSVLSGLLIGEFWHQSAFIAHDVCHNGVLPQANRKFNWMGWIHGSVIFGISTQKWLVEHNIHHAMCLRPLHDPQFNYLPIWLQSFKELKFVKLDFLSRILVPFQHYTWLALSLGVGRVNFYFLSFLFAAQHKVWMDFLGMALYWCWYGSLVYAQPDRASALTFFLISSWWIGILHVQLLISHLATDVFHREEELALGFFQFQMRTSRNIDSQWYLNWFHGGLEFQIEHHLFPQMPRHRLSKARPMVQKLAAKHGIPYMESSFTEAVKICLKDFRRTARALATCDF